MTTDFNRYIDSARRAVRWIVEQQRPDGSFFEVDAGIGGYYKVPYALGMSGFIPEAMRLLGWVRTHHLTRAGDFRAPSRKATLAVHDDWPTYGNAWLIQGAHRLGRFDLSIPGAEFLLRHQAACGGFCALENGKQYVECVGTSWAGLAQLTVGNREAASAAARCLGRLVDQQNNSSRFYFRMTPDGELITDVPDGQALAYFVDSARTGQIYFHPGIAMIFLCRYHMATGEASALRTAEIIFDFTGRCQDDVYCFPPSGKLGLGCALLAMVTGDRQARDAAASVASYLVRTQTDAGFWRLPDEEVYQSIAWKDDPEILMDITAEFATFLQEIAAAMS